MKDYLFRIDDVSLNTDEDRLIRWIDLIRARVPGAHVMLAVSPAVTDPPKTDRALDRERLFPSMWHTVNDHRVFYQMDRLGIPPCVARLRGMDFVRIAAHGLVHVDHRLMKRSAQELSIVMCCRLLKTATFVPPFNKWNRKTEAICAEHGIDLVRYSAEWTHLGYHPFNHDCTRYYVHTHDLTDEQFRARLP